MGSEGKRKEQKKVITNKLRDDNNQIPKTNRMASSELRNEL
jgi:hypothetical protein